jgi:hypothetical protein
MIRQIVAGALLAGALVTGGFAQVDKKKLMSNNPKSPAAEAAVTINGKQIWIVYHAPSVNGRKIFGGEGALQPDDTVWRAGADWATVLHTDAALDLGGVAVPPGDYSLYVFLDKGKWQLVVNKQTGQWGIKRDGSTTLDESQTVGKAAMNMSKPPAPVEVFKITLSDAGGNQGKLQMEWENVAASVPFSVKN